MLPLINDLKRYLKRSRDSGNPIVAALFFFYRPLKHAALFCFDGNFRSLVFLKTLKHERVHQVSNFTKFDRYPLLFSACRDIFKDFEGLRILSYGCSTGEEVFTLKHYFPDASILGTDINPRNIKQCQQKESQAELAFVLYESEETLLKRGLFQLIFCLAVLQRSENRESGEIDSSKIYPFEKFNKKIVELDQCLAVGGAFVIDHADYHFMDSSVASRYKPLAGRHTITRSRPRYGPDNQKKSLPFQNDRIFIKIRAAEKE